MRISSDRLYYKSGEISTEGLQIALSTAVDTLPPELKASVESASVRQLKAGLGPVEVALLLIFAKPVAERTVNSIWDAIEKRIRREDDKALTEHDRESNDP